MSLIIHVVWGKRLFQVCWNNWFEKTGEGMLSNPVLAVFFIFQKDEIHYYNTENKEKNKKICNESSQVA